jgi:hypothetical protein
MHVKFVRDVFDAGVKVHAVGDEKDGDFARHVRRGNAVELKAKEQEKDKKKDEPKK